MFQAVLIFSKESSLFGSLKHQTKITLHWLLNTIGILCILTAFAAIYFNKEEKSKSHFTSWHGLIGKLNEKSYPKIIIFSLFLF